jgi:hypothetical protein
LQYGGIRNINNTNKARNTHSGSFSTLLFQAMLDQPSQSSGSGCASILFVHHHIVWRRIAIFTGTMGVDKAKSQTTNSPTERLASFAYVFTHIVQCSHRHSPNPKKSDATSCRFCTALYENIIIKQKSGAATEFSP